MDWLLRQGRTIFALAIVAIGVETLLFAKTATVSMGPEYQVGPVIPFLPAVPWLLLLFGVIWVACGGALLFERTQHVAALTLGTLLFLCTLILEAPKNARHPASVGLITIVFEVLSLAALAWTIPKGPSSIAARAGRYLYALALVVFGIDHFRALAFIATLLPSWIPWHMFWVALFGVAFIAAGLGIATGILARWAAAGVGLMFAIWVVTLHLPRVLGLYGIPGATQSPAEWSSLFIAVALWGGSWALAMHLGPRRAAR